jgi:predicted nucleic acid-binding protein
MHLSDYTTKERIFIDANIFIYNALDDPIYGVSSSIFLKKIEEGELNGVINTFVVDEVLFKILVAKASEYIVKPTMRKIKKRMRELDFSEKVYAPVKEYREYIFELSMAGLNILEVDVDSIKRAVELGARYGLLITDSIHLSTMDKNRIGNIATNDGDFDRVDFIQAWKP